MSIDTVRDNFDPELRDELASIRKKGFQRYKSQWTRIDASASVSFTHGLGDIPHIADILVASDSQGSDASEGSSYTATKDGKAIVVTNAGAARFFQVRAF